MCGELNEQYYIDKLLALTLEEAKQQLASIDDGGFKLLVYPMSKDTRFVKFHDIIMDEFYKRGFTIL